MSLLQALHEGQAVREQLHREVQDMPAAAWMRLLIIGLVAAMSVADARAASLTGPAKVIDGESIVVSGQRVRLYALDAPEIDQTCRRNGQTSDCGMESAAALREKIGNQPVTCDARGVDRYWQTLATCSASGVDLGGWMVDEGYAVADARYSRRYEAQEAEAKAAHRGLWSGEFVTPVTWRHSHPNAGL